MSGKYAALSGGCGGRTRARCCGSGVQSKRICSAVQSHKTSKAVKTKKNQAQKYNPFFLLT